MKIARVVSYSCSGLIGFVLSSAGIGIKTPLFWALVFLHATGVAAQGMAEHE